MRFLRMLSNSVIGGALASAYLTILVLHLNPAFPLTADAVGPLAMALGLAYGVNLAVLFYGLIVFCQLLATDVLSPGWVSVRLLSWLCALAAGAVALLMWLNLGRFDAVLDAPAAARMTAGALTLSVSAAVFLLIALAHVGRRGGGVSAALLLAMMALSVAAPAATRGWGASDRLTARPVVPLLGAPSTAAPRVVLIALDGASLDVISPAVAGGRLPSIGRIFDEGAVLHLATLSPTQAEPVWSAALTGRAPVENGVRASARYRARAGGPALELLPDYCFAYALVRFGFLHESAHDAASLRARPVWDIASGSGVPVGVIGFPLTHPAPTVLGYLVSDELHRLPVDALGLDAPAAVAPPAMVPAVLRALADPATPDPVVLVSTTAPAPAGDGDARPDPAPVLADRMHLQIYRALDPIVRPKLTAVRLPGLDAVGHHFLRFANPSAFGDVSPDEQQQFGRVLDEYYGFIDAVVGGVIASLDGDDLLLVVSPFGMEPLSPGKRLLERLFGNARLSGSHERAPDGFVLAYGAAVRPGRAPRGSVLDLTPTVLYYLGLPVGRDMQGFARTDLFRDAFTASRPITFIPTWGR